MAVPQKRYQGLVPEGAVSRKQLKAAITACTRWEEVGETLPALLPLSTRPAHVAPLGAPLHAGTRPRVLELAQLQHRPAWLSPVSRPQSPRDS